VLYGGELILVTGPSGTGVRRALKKYQAWCVQGGKPILRVISLEDDFLIEAAAPIVSSLEAIAEADVGLIEVLLLPKPILEDLWLAAFRKAVETAEEYVGGGDRVILTFHAVWYHQLTREYLSAVNFRALGELETLPTALVTLIDDIFDVKARLSTHGQIFATAHVPESEFVDAIVKLFRILDWRNLEVVLSSKIAEACGLSRHYLLAVKHRIGVFHELLWEENRTTVYLAHPISQVRRMLINGAKQAEADDIVRQIKDLTRELQQDAIVFEPTAIDELRLDLPVTLDKMQYLVPHLGTRWPLPSDDEDDLLFVSPDENSEVFGERWRELGDSIAARGVDDQEQSIAEIKQAGPLMSALREQIVHQVTWRDYFLVNQSDVIVAYRPVWCGNESGGVRNEISYLQKLGSSGRPSAKAMILHLDGDEKAACLRLFFGLLDGWSRSGEMQANESQISRCKSEIQMSDVEHIRTASTDGAAGEAVRDLLLRWDIKFQPSVTGRAMVRDPAATVNEEERARGRSVRGLRSYLGSIDEDASITLIREDITMENFAQRVSNAIHSS